jgi:hypothetical protein
MALSLRELGGSAVMGAFSSPIVAMSRTVMAINVSRMEGLLQLKTN